MKRQMIFRQLYYDRQLIDGATISFFTESNDQDASVTLMSEDQAIRWLFNNSPIKDIFIDGFFLEPSYVVPFFGLREPFTDVHKKPGDIDLLLVDERFPNSTIAFECKRVKAISIDADNAKVNNINGIRHGVIQANKYQSLGFHKSYLMIIMLEDSRTLDAGNAMMRNSKSEDVEKIYEIPWNEKLHDDVGIVFVNVTQPTGKHYNSMGGIGFCIDKPAQSLDQTIEMTNKVKRLLKGIPK